MVSLTAESASGAGTIPITVAFFPPIFDTRQRGNSLRLAMPYKIGLEGRIVESSAD